MFNLFGKKTNSAPEGEIATTIIEVATNSSLPEVDWPSVFSVVESIKGFYSTNTPNEGAIQALKAIRFRLDSTDPVAINYTLLLLDTCFKNCDRPFQVQVASKENQKHIQDFLKRPTVAAENRTQCLEMIAEWSTLSDVPDIKQLFHTLVKAGFRFSPQALSKLSPDELARLQPQPQQPTQQRYFFASPAGAFVSPVPVVQQTIYVNQPYIPQQIVQARPDITQVSHEERVKWVNHDCGLADNSVAMLAESLNFAEAGSDISRNEIAVESYNRCLEIQKRLVAHVERVQEPDLVDKLITANAAVVGVLDQYNNMRSGARVGNNTAVGATANEGLLIDVNDSVQVPAAAPYTFSGSATTTPAPAAFAAPQRPVQNKATAPENPFAD